jgi:hypothetical protein
MSALTATGWFQCRLKRDGRSSVGVIHRLIIMSNRTASLDRVGRQPVIVLLSLL